MENPFELLDQKLTNIEGKLDILLECIDNPKDFSNLTPTWVTTKQLAQHLGLSVAAITNLRGKKIPYYKVGGRMLFKKEEVDEFLENTRHKTSGEHLNEYLNSGEGRDRLSQSRL